MTSDETRRLLENAEKEVDPNSDEGAALRVFRRELDTDSKLPTELVERRAKVSGDAYEVWKKARADSNFAAMRPITTSISKSPARCLISWTRTPPTLTTR